MTVAEEWELKRAVLDASAVLAVVSGNDPRAAALTSRLPQANLIAPTVLPYEVTNVIRRRWAGGLVSLAQATQSLESLAELNIELFQWAILADRVWQLRGSITTNDASYVALAEIMDCPLLTADVKLAAMAPVTCQVVVI
ncbi:MAG: type II toxin-antitoxin system VapC family toxin [Propionibacteriaceae bacterium]|nr:type II toxin-antitoxin system VapC family toxin [Propionibacteriaceae bacterium]